MDVRKVPYWDPYYGRYTYIDNLVGFLDKKESNRFRRIRWWLVHHHKQQQLQGIRNKDKHSAKNDPQLISKIQDDDVY